jgi:hypothetical protein
MLRQKHKGKWLWAAPLPRSLRQADIFKAPDIPHSHPFMDSQRTTFSVRASTSLSLQLAWKESLEFSVVLADGSFVTVNSASHPDCAISSLHLRDVSHIFFPPVFWALRGGGAGSWGVIIDATLPTLPIFSATLHTVNVLTVTLDQTASLMITHAKHISDWDQVRAGQYFYLTGSTTNSTLVVSTLFKDLDGDASKAQMSSFLSDAAKVGAFVQGETTITTFANDIVGFPDDASGYNTILSSRLIPGSVYSNEPESVGPAYSQLLSQGIQSVLGHLVAGGAFDFRDDLWPYSELTVHVGQVAANAYIDSAVNPAWRSAKTHVSILCWYSSLSQIWSILLGYRHPTLEWFLVRGGCPGVAKELYRDS